MLSPIWRRYVFGVRTAFSAIFQDLWNQNDSQIGHRYE